MRSPEGKWSDPDLRYQLTVDVPACVSEPAAETFNSFAVDDAVRDQAHGASHDVGARVPFR